jgi:hypothetical protein
MSWNIGGSLELPHRTVNRGNRIPDATGIPVPSRFLGLGQRRRMMLSLVDDYFRR